MKSSGLNVLGEAKSCPQAVPIFTGLGAAKLNAADEPLSKSLPTPGRPRPRIHRAGLACKSDAKSAGVL
jgi:hypothetical protein